jgi:hypothetical protein
MKQNRSEYVQKRFFQEKVILAVNFNVRKNNLLNSGKLTKIELDEINNI